MSSFTIAVLAYNEELAIGSVVQDLKARYSEHEILVINDGSMDKTADIVRELDVRMISHKSNRGYGASWKTALKHAKGDAVVFYDGDGQFDAADVGKLIEVYSNEGADMVVGERGASSHAPLMRRPGKRILKTLASFLVGQKIKDLNCGLRVVNRKTLLNYAQLLPDGFSASTTSLMLFLKRGYLVIYQPIIVVERLGSSSVRQIRDGFGTIILMTRMIALFNPLRIFLPVAAIFILGSVLYSLSEAITMGKGIPVLGSMLFVGGVLSFLLGVVSDQIASLRINQLGDPAHRGEDVIEE